MSESPSPPDLSPPSPPYHRDRRTALIIFGILEIGLGVLCLLMVGLLILSQTVSVAADETMTLRMLVPAFMVYVSLGAIFVCLGIGSMRCRRWARALILVLAWAWLCVGLIAVPVMAWFMPRILASSPQGGEPLPDGFITVVMIFQIALMSILFIVIPATLVLFYRSRHVKATCETRDPVPRWTDACPLPVLAVSCLAWWSAMMLLVLPASNMAMFPFFGSMLTGVSGSLVILLGAAVASWLGWAWYRLKPAAWWALAALIVLLGCSNAITFSRVDLLDVYREIGYPESQIDLIRKQGLINSQFMVWSSVGWLIPLLGYLVWVKRFFRSNPRKAPPEP